MHVQRIMQFDKQTGLNSLRELNPKIASIGLQKDEQLAQVGPSISHVCVLPSLQMPVVKDMLIQVLHVGWSARICAHSFKYAGCQDCSTSHMFSYLHVSLLLLALMPLPCGVPMGAIVTVMES